VFEIRLRAVVRHAPRGPRRLAGGPFGLGALMNAQPGLGEGHGRMLRRCSVVLGVLTFLVVGACDGSSDPDSTATTSADTSVVTSPTSTTSTPTRTSTTPSTTTLVDTSVEVRQAWDAFWQAWATVRASDDLNPGPLEEVATVEVAAGVVALFEGQRESGSGPVVTDVVTHTNVTELGPGEAEVEDCVLLSPSFTESVGVWYRAELTNTGTGWIVTDLNIPSLGGCVPQQMATEAIASYEAYYEAASTFWDPPDPESPLVTEVLAEPRLSNVKSLLQEHKTRGAAFRSNPMTHPEVIEVRSPTELVILDCYEPDIADGLYDLDTGERLPDEPAVEPGQRNLRSAVMVFEDGKWKSSDFQGQVDFECEFAPTERGLPSV
jgi:hypothetical protein